MENQPSFKEKMKYAVDNTFSKGTISLIGWLGILSLILIVIAAIVITLTGAHLEGEEQISFLEAFWRALMRTLDAGTMGGDTGWGFRIIMFGVTIGGVFVISTLIGLLTTAVESKLDELRKGRSRVLENNHTIILGWSDQIFTIIPELVLANENLPKSCIVILGDKDKVEMEDEIREKVGDTGKTRIVCRSGNPMETEDLKLVSLNAAKSIIILSPDGEAPDSEVIKVVLAITNHPERRKEPYHIVAALRDTKNAEIAAVVGKDEVEWIQVGNLIARIIAQTCRQSGLSVIYTELLDFGGDEIYFTEPKELLGKTYGETLNKYEKNTVMGIAPKGGAASLNPPMDTVLKPGDKLVVIAEDDDKILFNPNPPAFQANLIVNNTTRPAKPERTLVLGWNWRGCAIMGELENYVAPGSEAWVVANESEVGEQLFCGKVAFHNMKVNFTEGDITDRRTLEKLDLFSFDHIILLSYSDKLTAQQADSRTLIALLHLRDISEKSGHDFSIVSEMLDVRNRNLAEVTRADDFIVSDKLVSLMMAQVAENKGLNSVFVDMFDPEGAEVYLKPAENYVKLDTPVDFYTVIESARQRGETTLGYLLSQYEHDASRAYGVTLNPQKSEPVTFSANDRIVLLAES